MYKNWASKFLSISLLVLAFWPTISFAQDNTNDEFEVYLDFRHRGVINAVVTTYYKDDRFYLPVNELFSLLQIEHNTSGLITTGDFGTDQIPYTIDLKEQQIRFGSERITLDSEDFLVKELDNYLLANIFEEAFKLNFSIDFNNLSLGLETVKEIPAVENAIRRQRRQRANFNRTEQENYEIRYPRKSSFIDGGFLDYNLSANLIPDRQVYNLNTNIGLQVAGGDVQGSLFGSYSDDFTSFATDNLRWRYMSRDKSWISKVTIGQTLTDGFSNNRYTGIRLTNEPIEPRQLFDEFEIRGTTIPESEVELYKNNALIDFQRSDEMGNYRFLTPITYGSSHLNLKIFGPTGQIIERAQRIQVPFSFQPKGAFNYTFNAGRLDNPQFGEITQRYTMQGHGSYGVTDWLTAKTGVEYYESFHTDLPTFTGTLSTRLLSSYLLTLEAATQAYYRGGLNVIYPSSASISIDYTEFTSGFGFYNPSNDDSRLIASIFYPINFFGFPLNFRTSTFSRFRDTGNNMTLRTDLSTRIGRMNFRFGYSDRFIGEIDPFNPTPTSILETAVTYTISRNREIPSYLRGAFLRAQMRYKPGINEIESAEMLISRNILKKGRLQLSAGRNFAGNFNNVRFSLVLDFNKVRNSTTFSNLRTGSTFTQNIRGSIGYDSNYNNLIFTSRDQVGRSGTAVQLFIDNNDNGIFDENDETINDNAVRILRSGATSIRKNNILYLTQMQPYFHYNMEVNKGAIRNPLLVPEFEKFGIISDPNTFKKIEIPFYMSGVIEGQARRTLNSGTKNGIGGLKLLLLKENGELFKEIRTFSDGSFYDYEVPPGKYTLQVDDSQLEILNSISVPDKIEFELESTAQGDFVEGLNFTLKPKEATEKDEEPISASIGAAPSEDNAVSRVTIEYNITVENIANNNCRFELQYASFNNRDNAVNYIQTLEEDSIQLVYNTNGRIFALRSKPGNSSLYDAVAKANRATENPALIWNCNPSPETQQQVLTSQTSTQYYLQFAALSNPQKAASFSDKLNRDFNLNTTVVFDEQSYLYKIKEGPFNASDEASARRTELLNTTAIGDIYLSKELNTQTKLNFNYSEINSAFRYILYLGDFSTERSATLYAMRIDEAFGLTTKILSDGDYFYLVSDEKYENWDEFLSGFTQVENSTEFSKPYVLLKQVQE